MCTDQVNGYLCTCPDDFGGINCQNSKCQCFSCMIMWLPGFVSLFFVCLPLLLMLFLFSFFFFFLFFFFLTLMHIIMKKIRKPILVNGYFDIFSCHLKVTVKRCSYDIVQ